MSDELTPEEIAAVLQGRKDKTAKEKADKEAKDKADKEAADKQKADEESLGDAGKRALDAERAKVKDAEKRARDAEAALKAKTDAEEVAKTEAAKTAGDFEKLYKAELEKREKLEKDAVESTRRELRAKVAKAHNLPDDVADRLMGDTEEALAADAAKLAQHVKPVATAAETETGNRNGTTDKSKQVDPTKATYKFVPEGAVAIPPD